MSKGNKDLIKNLNALKSEFWTFISKMFCKLHKMLIKTGMKAVNNLDPYN